MTQPVKGNVEEIVDMAKEVKPKRQGSKEFQGMDLGEIEKYKN